MDINYIKELVRDSEIISFDIFDTLLLRPYAKPVDLFRHLEYIHRAEYFYEERILAEKKARKFYSNQEDITYNQIYEFLPEKFQFFKSEEIHFEKQVLTPNFRIKEIFDYAKVLGKKIIIVSDMYLESRVLSDILISKGFSGWDKLYVSSELGKAKYTGSVYNLIIKESGFPPEKILHIGDNYKADYLMAVESGIKAIHIEKPLDLLFLDNPRAKIFYNRFQNYLGTSIILGLISIALCNNCVDKHTNYWKYFGFVYGGPVCFSFMKWVLENAKKLNLEKLLFIARDGWILEKVFNLINTTDIKTEYIYAPRKLSLAVTVDYLRRIPTEAESVTSALMKIYEENRNILFDDPEPAPYDESVEEKLDFIEKHKDVFEKISKISGEKYLRYLKTFSLEGCKFAIVDTITTYFTAQKLIEKVLKSKIFGFYWVTNLFHFTGAELFYDFLSFNKTKRNNIIDWRIMEFIMTSPEPPILKLSDEGIVEYTEDITVQEKNRIDSFGNMEDGVLSFSQMVLNIFGNIDLYLDNLVVTGWINLFCDISTEYEKEQFSNFGFATDINHSEYNQIPRKWFIKPVAKKKKFVRKISNIEKVFSIRNEDKHKVVRVCGIKIKFKKNLKV